MYAAIKDTHATFSGYSIAIPEVGHPSRRPRPTRTGQVPRSLNGTMPGLSGGRAETEDSTDRVRRHG
jgi:hypothetical protein